MLNWIWLGLVLLAVLLGAASGQLAEITGAAFEACKTAVMTLALPLAGIMALWLGVMRLAEKSGLVGFLAAALRPIMRWLFPDVPANHPAMGSMVMNMAANMLGLANAATPLGLRAMQDLERLNPRPGVATNAMCTFLAINTSSIQLIPATAVAILSAAGATNPTSIIGTAFIATVCSTAAGIIAVKSLEKLSWFALPKIGGGSRETVPASNELVADPAEVSPLRPDLADPPRLDVGVFLRAFRGDGVFSGKFRDAGECGPQVFSRSHSICLSSRVDRPTLGRSKCRGDFSSRDSIHPDDVSSVCRRQTGSGLRRIRRGSEGRVSGCHSDHSLSCGHSGCHRHVSGGRWDRPACAPSFARFSNPYASRQNCSPLS